MHMVLAPGNVGGLYTAGDPTNGIPRTRIDAGDLNILFTELKHLVEGSGLALNGGDETQVLQAVQRIARGRSTFRNALINGDFSLSQRFGGASTTVTDGSKYVWDRWIVDSGEDGVTAAVQVVATSAQSASLSRTFARLTQNTAAQPSRKPAVLQRIEGAHTFAGRRVAVSFTARAVSYGVGLLTITPVITQNWGSTGGVSPVVLTGAPIVISTIAPTRYTAIFDLGPVPSGVTNWSPFGDDYLEVRLESPAALGGGLIYEIGDIQTELDAPSEFERVPPSLNWLACQRYFTKSYSPHVAVGTNASANRLASLDQDLVALGLTTRLPVPMRSTVTPVIHWYAPDGTIDNVNWNGVNVPVTATNASFMSTGAPTVGSSQSLSYCLAHFSMESEL